MKNNFDLHKWKEYQLFLNESENDEDDWNVDSSFNVKHLKAGDTIKGLMWNWQAIVDYIKETWSNHPIIVDRITKRWKDIYDNGVEIIKVWDDEEEGYLVSLILTLEYEDYTYPVEFIEKLLNPKYKIELPLFESDDSDEDDWNVDSSFKHELKVGDYFYTTPPFDGVWTKLENVPSDIQNFVRKIIYIGPNEGKYKNPNYYDDDILVFEFAFDPINFYVFTIDYFNEQYSDLINAYVPTDLNESDEDDDWNVDSSFNVTYLTVGDTIKGSMWNWQAIVDYIKETWSNHPIIVDTEINDWKNIYDNGVEIIEIFDDFEDLPGYFVTLNSGENTDYENHQYLVEFIEKLLNPKYKIELPLFESDDSDEDDWNVDSSFTVKNIYLGKGDTIKIGGMLPSNYYIVGFEDNNVLLKKNNSEYISKFPIDMVQNKMEDGYILDPYK